MEPDFWYIVGYGYEVVIFRTKEEAEKAADDSSGGSGYWYVFGGRYGEEFSGWIGDHV